MIGATEREAMIRIDFPDVAALQPGVVLRCYHFLRLPQRMELEPVQESPSALCCVELHLLLVQYPVRRERRARGEVFPWKGPSATLFENFIS